MEEKKKYPVTIIRRSCLTGKPVWIYRGPSREAAKMAYWRACKSEIEYVTGWAKRMEEQASILNRFLSECVAKIPINAELTQVQKNAIRNIRRIIKNPEPCYMEFYNHIMEERRRRAEDREIRRQMREREQQEKMKHNTNYDK